MSVTPKPQKPPSNGRIFINYRRDDAPGVAGRLADSLDRYFGAGKVFRDVDGIRAGAHFDAVLDNTVQEADAMIVLIGSRWLTAANSQGQPRLQDPEDWVAREIALALERQIPVFPVLVESAMMPRPAELPPSLQALSRHNALSLSDQRWHADVTRLAKVVAIDLPGSAAERLLLIVQWVVSLALLLALSATSANVAWEILQGATSPPQLWVSGASFVVIVGASGVLLYAARWVDPGARIWIYLAAQVGLAGTLVFWLVYGLADCTKETTTQCIDDIKMPIVMVAGSTFVGLLMLVLMNASRFKAR